MSRRKTASHRSFNPHPSRRTGATWGVPPNSRLRAWFQSSPVPKDGCNWLGTGTARMCICSFNPHPSRRTGATKRYNANTGVAEKFQSSPVPKDGCNQGRRRAAVCAVQGFNPHPSRRTGATGNADATTSVYSVSILTRPEGRVQRTPLSAPRLPRCRFNPHPSRRTGATSPTPSARSRPLVFQSSPVPKDGCN